LAENPREAKTYETKMNNSYLKSSSFSKCSSGTGDLFLLHSNPHDFCSHSGPSKLGSSSIVAPLVYRKILSSSIAHIAVILLWIGGMVFHACFISNYSSWVEDPTHLLPSVQVVSSIVGQSHINASLGAGFRGIYTTSGFFSLFLSNGLYTDLSLKLSCCVILTAAFLLAVGAFYHMHVVWPNSYSAFSSFSICSPNFAPLLSVQHICTLISITSTSLLLWSGHCVHLTLSSSLLLSSNLSTTTSLYSSFSVSRSSIFAGSATTVLSSSQGCLAPSSVAAHHLFLAISLIVLLPIINSTRLSRNSSSVGSSWSDNTPFLLNN
jgi:hypothetical protein